jgi:prepilin-type N-terminal cleavage/methylation domain-containing protein
MQIKPKAFSIIEVMIGLAIMSIVGSTVVTLVGNKMRENRLNSLQIAKDRIIRQVEEGLTNYENLQDAYTVSFGALINPNNREMGICMNAGAVVAGAVSVPCPANFIGSANYLQNTFDLWARPVPTVPGMQPVPIRLSGYWSKDGEPNCEPSLRDCPFYVTTYFYFTCPLDRSGSNAPPATQCITPSRLNLLFSIRGTGGDNRLNKGFVFDYPPANIDPKSRVISVSVDAVRNTPAQICPPKMYISGFDHSGAVVCACYSNRPVPGSNPNIPAGCQDNGCADDEVIVGYNGNDGNWNPVCKKPKTLRACIPSKVCSGSDYMTKADLKKCLPFMSAPTKKNTGPGFTFNCGNENFECCSPVHF